MMVMDRAEREARVDLVLKMFLAAVPYREIGRRVGLSLAGVSSAAGWRISWAACRASTPVSWNALRCPCRSWTTMTTTSVRTRLLN